MDKIKPAIVAVGYNRIESLKRLLVSLNEAVYPDEDIPLIVSIDRSDVFEDVRRTAEQTGWKHGKMDIRVAEERLGLRKHILRCGDLSAEYGAVIILEDDLIVAANFYTYVQQALAYSESIPESAGIALYSHAWNEHTDYHFQPQPNGCDTYLGQFSVTWGQCWSAAQWQAFKQWYLEHEDRLAVTPAVPADIGTWGDQSWGKYFVCYIVDTGRYYIMPYTALSTNCSEVGEHNGIVNATYQVVLMDCPDKQYRFPAPGKAVKYDIFFERVLGPGVLIHGIPAADICMDLNASHTDPRGKRFLLTTRRFRDRKPLCSWGMQLRPIEQNVLKNIPGNDIFLYPCRPDESFPPAEPTLARIEYESYNTGWRRALKYSGRNIVQMVKGIIEG